MTEIKFDIWKDEDGTGLYFSGDLGEESRTLLGKNSKIVHSFFASSHFDAMTKYYQFMGWGAYTSNYEIDKEPYNLQELQKRSKLYARIDEILWKDWDPLGVNDLAPRDEYRSYVPQILNLVMNDKGNEIEERLYYLETQTMGIEGNKKRCAIIARKVLDEL